MNRGMPSMTALFSMLAIAGYQNRDKLADMFRDATSGQPAGAKNSLSSMLGKSWRSRGRRWSRFAPERRPRRVARALQAEWARGRGPILDQSGAEPGSHPARTPDVLQKLEQQTGLSQQEILDRLSRELPTAVDQYTPDGRLPAPSA